MPHRSLIVVCSVALCGAVLGTACASPPKGDPQAGEGASGDASPEPPPNAPVAGPTITDFAYLKSPAGPRILIAGTETAGALARVRLDFLDGGGNPAMVDLDGDDVPDSTTFNLVLYRPTTRGRFFLENQSAEGFELRVPRVAATPIDVYGREGASVTAAFASAPVRSDGQRCDARGFDVCAPDAVCAPGIPDAVSACAPAASVRGDACMVAPTLDPAKGPASVIGKATGVSLWDPPAGCVPNDVKGRPEGVATLHLAAAALSLTLSTVDPATEFDTVIYLLPACAAATAPTTPCNDDEGTPASTLHLSDVPAGDYLVVVDSIAPEGGTYRLTVRAE